MPVAVCLLSGGLDSATACAIAHAEGFAVHALSFEYGQRHACELDAARRVARSQRVEAHHVVALDLRAFRGSALTDPSVAVPKTQGPEQQRSIPVTYVPARNTIFLSYALGLAEVVGARDVFIGVNAVDYSGYPDCRPEYLHAFEALARLATKVGVEGGEAIRIRAPLVHWTKAEIILRGTELSVDYGLTVSCYDPDSRARACGACESCRFRRDGFERAGVADPTRYAGGEA